MVHINSDVLSIPALIASSLHRVPQKSLSLPFTTVFGMSMHLIWGQTFQILGKRPHTYNRHASALPLATACLIIGKTAAIDTKGGIGLPPMSMRAILSSDPIPIHEHRLPAASKLAFSRKRGRVGPMLIR
jgi:hypothetical protein